MDKFKNNEVNDIYPDNNNYDPLHSSESDSDISIDSNSDDSDISIDRNSDDSDISIDSNSDDSDIDNNRECGTALYSYGTHTHLGTEDFKFNKDFLKIILKSFIVASLAVLLYFLI
jgi:hypothetical protein